MYRTLWVALALGVFGCGGSPEAGDPENEANGARFAGELGILVSEADRPLLLEQCSRPAPEGVEGWWQPNATDIASFESGLRLYLAEHVVEPPLPISLEQYRGRYAGIMRDGRRLIYASFHVPLPGNREEEGSGAGVVTVCDGGRSAFGIEYDIQRRTYQELHFNGTFR